MSTKPVMVSQGFQTGPRDLPADRRGVLTYPDKSTQTFLDLSRLAGLRKEALRTDDEEGGEAIRMHPKKRQRVIEWR